MAEKGGVMTEPRGTFAARFRRLLAERGLRQADLAELMGRERWDTKAICAWYHGATEPSYASLHELHDALGCTWEELMGE